MKKWFLALLTTLMALMLSVASAENVPLASETVEAFKETT